MYSLPKNVYRERIDFSKIKTTIPIPNLIEIQKKSYERFLQMNRLASEREDAGLQSVFKSVFPISDFRENSSLEFIEYSIGNWECKCGKLQGLHHLRKPCAGCGNVLITENGTFIINGTERVIVSQLHRSPGAFFHSEDKTLFVAQIIPYRGSWVEFEYDAKNLLYVRIDRKRKFLATVFLRALGLRGADEIVRAFYRVDKLHLKNGKIYCGVADSLVGLRAATEIQVPGGEFTTQSGKTLTKHAIEALKKANVEAVEISDAELEGAYDSAVVVDLSTGEVILDAK